METKKVNRLGYLDSARGWAALAVMIFHTVLTIFEKKGDFKSGAYFFYDYFDLGKMLSFVFL